jgi:hypothetical protein
MQPQADEETGDSEELEIHESVAYRRTREW